MLPSLLARKRREIEQTRVEADARLASLRQVELENERRREFGEGEQQGRKRKVTLNFLLLSHPLCYVVALLYWHVARCGRRATSKEGKN